MKKFLAIACVCVLAFGLVACGGNGGAAQTTYTARAAAESHGWTDELKVTYDKDGNVVDAVFESYDADGNKKSEASAEVYPMEYSPSEWMPLISNNIKVAGSAANVEVVAGATTASNAAKVLFAAIEEAKAAGADSAETILVEMPAE